MLGWILSVGIIATVTFSTYDMVKEEGDGPVMWSKERLVAWEVLSRSAWAVCICWMIFGIHYGGGGTDYFWISLRSLLENCELILPKMLWFEFSLNFHENVCIKYVYICRLLAGYDQLEDMGTFSQISVHFLLDTCCCYITVHLCTDVIGRYDTR